jgi:hypothetical protein
MIAIETKYHGATNSKGSRYSATTCNGQRLTLSADYSLNSDENHERVAVALAGKMNWLPLVEKTGKQRHKLVGGGTKSGMAWVFVEA